MRWRDLWPLGERRPVDVPAAAVAVLERPAHEGVAATTFAPLRLDPCSLDIPAPEGGCYWCGGELPHAVTD